MKRISGLFLFTLIISSSFAKAPHTLCVSQDSPFFPQGNGSKEQPYLVCNRVQFDRIGLENGLLNQFFILGTDLNYATQSYHIIGSDTAPFTGGMNGNGYTLSSVTIPTDRTEFLAPFGYVEGGEIINLNVKGTVVASSTSTKHVGGVVGFASNTKLSNVKATEMSLAGRSYLGGLVGEFINGSLINSSAENGTLLLKKSADIVGGLAGWVEKSDVNACKSATVLQPEEPTDMQGGIGLTDVGGFIGHVSESRIKNVYSRSALHFENYPENFAPTIHIAGLIGSLYESQLDYAYYAGEFLINAAGDYVGSILGRLVGNICVQHTFANVDLQGPSNGLGSFKTTAELQSKDFWIDQGLNKNIWKIVDGKYPTLKKVG